MDGQQLKRWRENRKLTQNELAEHLGWTRDRLANIEADRTTLKEDIEPVLEAIDRLLGKAASKQSPKLPHGSKRRYLTAAGLPLRFEDLPRQLHACYYEYGWRDKTSGHHHCFHMQVGRDWDGTIRGLSTPLNLDATTWRVSAQVMADDPAVIRGVQQAQAILDANASTRPPFDITSAPTNPVDNSQAKNIFDPPT